MKATSLSNKSREILDEIAHGRSVFEILVGDLGVTCHDIFHAVSEAPTRFWTKAQCQAEKAAFLCPRHAVAKPICQRVD
jgi:hypothetical protein